MGLWQGIAAGQWAVVSALANSLVLLVFIALWKRLTRDQAYEWQGPAAQSHRMDRVAGDFAGILSRVWFQRPTGSRAGTWGTAYDLGDVCCLGDTLVAGAEGCTCGNGTGRADIHHSPRAHLA